MPECNVRMVRGSLGLLQKPDELEVSELCQLCVQHVMHCSLCVGHVTAVTGSESDSASSELAASGSESVVGILEEESLELVSISEEEDRESTNTYNRSTRAEKQLLESRTKSGTVYGHCGG